MIGSMLTKVLAWGPKAILVAPNTTGKIRKAKRHTYVERNKKGPLGPFFVYLDHPFR
jgi:hypothetical protein